MPRIDLDILNQKQTPAFYASSLATRPAAGFVGRIFIDSDSPSTGLYRDTGTAWVQIADPGAGTTGTLQQVTTNGSSTNVGISVTSNGIGIGTTIPGLNRLDIHSASGINATFNGTGTTNAALQLQLAGVAKWTIQNNYNTGLNDFNIFNETLSSISLSIKAATGIVSIGTATASSILNLGGTVNGNGYYVNIASPVSAPTNGILFYSSSDNIASFQNVTGFKGEINFGLISANRVFTFQNKSYTIADNATFSNYLPLTGGTLSGAIAVPVNGSSFGLSTLGSYPLTITTNVSEQTLKILGKNNNNNVQFFDDAGTTFQAVLGTIGTTFYIGTGTSGATRLQIKSNGIFNLSNVPGSSAGLSSGDIYQTAGALFIVP